MNSGDNRHRIYRVVFCKCSWEFKYNQDKDEFQCYQNLKMKVQFTYSIYGKKKLLLTPLHHDNHVPETSWTNAWDKQIKVWRAESIIKGTAPNVLIGGVCIVVCNQWEMRKLVVADIQKSQWECGIWGYLRLLSVSLPSPQVDITDKFFSPAVQ